MVDDDEPTEPCGTPMLIEIASGRLVGCLGVVLEDLREACHLSSATGRAGVRLVQLAANGIFEFRAQNGRTN
jgi:hypothetical protein